MASINVTIQHSSPLIRYSGDWSQKDTIGGGFSWTESSGASATATFPAKWIQILGSRNKFHGAYTVSIDGKSYLRNGSTSDDQLTTLIFNETLVDSGEHTTIITNTEWMTLNIDSIKFTCDIGSLNASTSSSRLETTTNNASDPAFAYFPHGTWSMQSGLHSTSEVNASVNYTFSGDAVSIFGSSGPRHALYSVWRHGRPEYYNATRSIFSSKVHLYFATGFGPGSHTITLTNESPGLLQIHSAEVYSVLDTVPSSQPHSSSSSSSTSSHSTSTSLPILPPDLHGVRSTRLSAGAIVAISCAALLFVFLITAVWLLLRRNKSLWMRLQRGYMVQSQFDTSPPSGVTPLIYSPPPANTARVPRGRVGKTQYVYPTDDDESIEAPQLDRAVTMASQMTASTLVAEAGSDMTEVGRNGLKPLRLATRYRSGSEATTPSTVTTRDSRRSTRLFPSPTTPSTRQLLREAGNRADAEYYGADAEYYDPYAARLPGLPGLEEVPEDQVDDLLRHPIRRHESSILDDWQHRFP